MKHLEEYRQSKLVDRLAERIRALSPAPVQFMEVCGGHTMTVHKFGLLSLLPHAISLISGPGCPVCVSGQGFIAALIGLASDPSVILATYGDLLRIPCGGRSLETERSAGSDIRIIYSVMEALSMAKQNPGRKVVFAGIGFETTAPLTAAAVIQAKSDGLTNFFVYSAHKIMPPALEWIATHSPGIRGFIAPGHVTTITGTSIYSDLVRRHRVSVVVSGFEPLDMMLGILMLTEQVRQDRFAVENAYRRVVLPEGNRRARMMIEEVFEEADAYWRGLGLLPGSGLRIRKEYAEYDAGVAFGTMETDIPEPKGCLCGEVITGRSVPADCPLFGTACTPENPVGACMVSREGACSVWYRYRSTA